MFNKFIGLFLGFFALLASDAIAKEITVQKGDTLWVIAKRASLDPYVYPKYTVRSPAGEIRPDANKIYPGDIVSIPEELVKAEEVKLTNEKISEFCLDYANENCVARLIELNPKIKRADAQLTMQITVPKDFEKIVIPEPPAILEKAAPKKVENTIRTAGVAPKFEVWDAVSFTLTLLFLGTVVLVLRKNPELVPKFVSRIMEFPLNDRMRRVGNPFTVARSRLRRVRKKSFEGIYKKTKRSVGSMGIRKVPRIKRLDSDKRATFLKAAEEFLAKFPEAYNESYRLIDAEEARISAKVNRRKGFIRLTLEKNYLGKSETDIAEGIRVVLKHLHISTFELLNIKGSNQKKIAILKYNG